MDYDLLELEKKYDVKLDNTQKEVLSSLIDFIESTEQTICLKSKGGCGKTLILSMLYDILDKNDFWCAIVAPTNKAKLVLSEKGGTSRESVTIHSLLNLRPDIDVMDFDASQLSFKFESKPISLYDVLLIDECSMINDDLYDLLCSKFNKSKIVFCGDEKQLSPVNQNHISKSFNTKCLYLNKIYRQQESKLYKVLEYLRHKPLYVFKNVSDENGNIIVCNNILDMLKQYSYLFKLSQDFKNYNLVKMITYTNNRINALNKIIRNNIYSDNSEYHIYEILTGYDNCSYNKTYIDNSKDYIVTKVTPTIINISLLSFDGYQLTLETVEGNKLVVRILSKNNPDWKLNRLSEYLETTRQQAIKSKNAHNWKLFFNMYNSFLTPFDLCYDNRVIKKKSLDYGYCISAHKSQSSTYSIVLIDMENIWRCTNKNELRQLQYVACSRTTSDLIIYQQNKEDYPILKINE